MSASIVSVSSIARSPAAAPEMPDIGGLRRSIAALVATAMVVIGLAAWTGTDAAVASTADAPAMTSTATAATSL